MTIKITKVSQYRRNQAAFIITIRNGTQNISHVLKQSYLCLSELQDSESGDNQNHKIHTDSLVEEHQYYLMFQGGKFKFHAVIGFHQTQLMQNYPSICIGLPEKTLLYDLYL